MVDFKKLTRDLNRITKQMGEKSKKEAELQSLFDKAMSYTSTNEVDFKIFTPEKILELANFAVEHGSEAGALMQLNNRFIKETLQARPIKRVFGCM